MQQISAALEVDKTLRNLKIINFCFYQDEKESPDEIIRGVGVNKTLTHFELSVCFYLFPKLFISRF